jgi:hypothetical protein
MLIEYLDEFKEGTTIRRVFLYEDNDDAIMTCEPLYEDEFEEEDDADGDYDGPVEEADGSEL